MTQEAIFSERLKFALKKRDDSIKNGNDLARLFNRQHLNGISVQTAYKWWNGRAIPTADKMTTLVAWLDVSEYWLHDGLTSAGPDQNV